MIGGAFVLLLLTEYYEASNPPLPPPEIRSTYECVCVVVRPKAMLEYQCFSLQCSTEPVLSATSSTTTLKVI